MSDARVIDALAPRRDRDDARRPDRVVEPPAERLYGWAEAEVLGRLCSRCWSGVEPLTKRPRSWRRSSPAFPGRATSRCCVSERRPGARVFVVDTPILDAHGTVLAIVGGSEDVTDQRLPRAAARRPGRAPVASRSSREASAPGDTRSARRGRRCATPNSNGSTDSRPDPSTGTSRSTSALLHPDDAAGCSRRATVPSQERSRFRGRAPRRLARRKRPLAAGQGPRHPRRVRRRHRNDGLRRRRHRPEDRDAGTRAHAGTDSGKPPRTSGCSANGSRSWARSTTRSRDRPRRARRDAQRHPGRGTHAGRLVLDLRAGRRRDRPRDGARARGPGLVAYVKALQERFPYDPDAATGIPQVIRTGESRVLSPRSTSRSSPRPGRPTRRARSCVHSGCAARSRCRS